MLANWPYNDTTTILKSPTIQQYNNSPTTVKLLHMTGSPCIFSSVNNNISNNRDNISQKIQQMSNKNDLNIDLKGIFQQYQSNNTVQFELKVQQYMFTYKNTTTILKSPTLQ